MAHRAGNPDAHAQKLMRAGDMPELQCSYRCENLFRNVCCTVTIGIGEKHGKFLATVAPCDIARTVDALTDAMRDCDQCVITRGVSL